MLLTKEVFPYVVILKNENARYANGVGLLISVLCIIFFVSEYFTNADRSIVWPIGAACMASVAAWNIWQSKKGKKSYYKPGFIIAAIVWLSMPYLHWLSILLIILYFLEHQVKRPQEIGFSEEKIVANSIFIKTYYWQDLSNVVLKDNILTLDFLNNRIIQKEVLDDDEPDADEDEFNDFCKMQLAANRR